MLYSKSLKKKKKTLEENRGSKILEFLRAIFFLIYLHSARETKEKINKWDYIKQKRFCSAQKTINKMEKKKPTEWENIFADDTFDEGLISKIYKELIVLNNKKTQLKPGQRTSIDPSKEDIQIVNRHMKRSYFSPIPFSHCQFVPHFHVFGSIVFKVCNFRWLSLYVHTKLNINYNFTCVHKNGIIF